MPPVVYFWSHPSEFSEVCLYVDGVSGYFCRNFHVDILQKYGQIVAIYFKVNQRDEGDFVQRGYGWVQYRTPDEATVALNELGLTGHSPNIVGGQMHDGFQFGLRGTSREFALEKNLVELGRRGVNFTSPRISLSSDPSVLVSSRDEWAEIPLRWVVNEDHRERLLEQYRRSRGGR